MRDSLIVFFSFNKAMNFYNHLIMSVLIIYCILLLSKYIPLRATKIPLKLDFEGIIFYNSLEKFSIENLLRNFSVKFS